MAYIVVDAGTHGVSLKEETALSQYNPAVDTATPTTALPPSPGHIDSDLLLSTILASLDDDKAEDVITVPLAGKSEMADHMVIASGRSSRQVAAICDKLADRLKKDLGIIARFEGRETGDWVLLDAGDVIVHVFRPEVRDFYQLEKMWMTDPKPASHPSKTV